MEDNIEIKSLDILGKVYVKYHIDGDVLFLNVMIPLPNRSIGESENFYTNFISIIENRKFKATAYLNI